jgi:hypothetical protein
MSRWYRNRFLDSVRATPRKSDTVSLESQIRLLLEPEETRDPHNFGPLLADLAAAHPDLSPVEFTPVTAEGSQLLVAL